MNRSFIGLACISGGIAVGLGAFAAHGLKAVLPEDSLRVFHTGVEYQFYHTFALLGVGLLQEKFTGKLMSAAGILFLTGIILFSGSLYLLSVNEALKWLGAVTPIGGLCFLGGWISLATGVLKSR